MTPPTQQASGAPAGRKSHLPGNALRRWHSANTPRTIGLLMVALVALAAVWGVVGAWTANLHASAAASMLNTNEPLSVSARQMYQSLSDADVTATTAFLSGPTEPLAMRQRYQADIAAVGADLEEQLHADAQSGNEQLSASLSTMSTGLPLYTGYVAEAQSDYALGYFLTGGSFMQVASEQMHLTLLPAARSISAQANARLAAKSAQATGLPWIVVTLVLSAALGIVLLRAQQWLSRRTHRTLNRGMLAATVAMAVATAWLIIAFVIANNRLQPAERHGSDPAQALAQATIAVQQGRDDQILNLISRTGSTSFHADFTATQRQVGPGPGTLLATAAAASQGGTAAGQIAAAEQDAQVWYTQGAKVFGLDVAANYAAETQLVIGSGPGSSAAGFTGLESDLGAALADDQAVFSAGASASANALTGLAIAFAVAALLMVAGCLWGLSQRLAEYR